MNTKSVTLFLIEDNEVDVQAVKRGLRKQKIANPVLVAPDGLEALAMLRAGEVPRPFLILLDLNLPRMNGIEFLQALRKDPAIRDAVVFVLTTSKRDEDRAAAYNQYIAGYMVKGEVADNFLRLTNLLDSYWHVVTLPDDNP